MVKGRDPSPVISSDPWNRTEQNQDWDEGRASMLVSSEQGTVKEGEFPAGDTEFRGNGQD